MSLRIATLAILLGTASVVTAQMAPTQGGAPAQPGAQPPAAQLEPQPAPPPEQTAPPPEATVPPEPMAPPISLMPPPEEQTQDTGAAGASKQEGAQPEPEITEPLAGWSDGTPFLRSADNQYVLFPGGRLQVDAYVFKRKTQAMPNDGFLVRRARLEVFGWIGEWFGFNIAGDFAAVRQPLPIRLRRAGSPPPTITS